MTTNVITKSADLIGKIEFLPWQQLDVQRDQTLPQLCKGYGLQDWSQNLKASKFPKFSVGACPQTPSSCCVFTHALALQGRIQGFKKGGGGWFLVQPCGACSVRFFCAHIMYSVPGGSGNMENFLI